jgi:hypothetical protein
MEPRDQCGVAFAIIATASAALVAAGEGLWLTTSFLLGFVASRFGYRFGVWLMDEYGVSEED